MNDVYKHFTLLECGINYARGKFYSPGLGKIASCGFLLQSDENAEYELKLIFFEYHATYDVFIQKTHE